MLVEVVGFNWLSSLRWPHVLWNKIFRRNVRSNGRPHLRLEHKVLLYLHVIELSIPLRLLLVKVKLEVRNNWLWRVHLFLRLLPLLLC